MVKRPVREYLFQKITLFLPCSAEPQCFSVLRQFENFFSDNQTGIVYPQQVGQNGGVWQTLDYHAIEQWLHYWDCVQKIGERALSEASLATIKSPRYGFNKPRAKTSGGCSMVMRRFWEQI